MRFFIEEPDEKSPGVANRSTTRAPVPVPTGRIWLYFSIDPSDDRQKLVFWGGNFPIPVDPGMGGFSIP